MGQLRTICSLMILLLVSNLSLAGQMVMLPSSSETEVVSSFSPCHQAEPSADLSSDKTAHEEMACCVDDCGHCLMSSLLFPESQLFTWTPPGAGPNLYSQHFTDRETDTLYRPPIRA